MFRGLFGGGGGSREGSAAEDGEAAPDDERGGDDEAEGARRRGGGGGGGGGARRTDGLSFDSRGLERAAKAAKELDRSPNARHALELVKEQERTKQSESNARTAEMSAYAKQLEIKRMHEESEESRKTLELQTEKQQQLEHYKDQLERKRQNDTLKQQIKAQQFLKDEERKKDEEAVARQEAIRRKTLEYDAELKRQTEIARVKAEAEGRTMQERQNSDIRLSELRANAREYRRTVLEAIRAAGTTVGTGVSEFLGDTQRLSATVVTLSALALGVYSSRAAAGAAGKYAESVLGKPSLVRETSRFSALEAVRRPLSTLRRAVSQRRHLPQNAGGAAAAATTTGGAAAAAAAAAPGVMAGLVLESALEQRLGRLAVAVANTRRNHAPFRNVLLEGPPGTGKTHFAKGLARSSGLDYAIVTGGDVAPLGRDAVTQIHKIFDWAQRSRRGLLLFIDEADAFLRRRSTERISEDLRSALNAFLYRTGEASDRFMLVLASNQPEQFDWAANDRIDDIVAFPLPGEEERHRMLKYYFRRYVTDFEVGKARRAAAVGGIGGWLASVRGGAAAPTRIRVHGVGEAELVAAARATAGFSGREIAKLAIGWQSAAFGSADAALSRALFDATLAEHLAQKRLKEGWAQLAERDEVGAADDVRGAKQQRSDAGGEHAAAVSATDAAESAAANAATRQHSADRRAFADGRR